MTKEVKVYSVDQMNFWKELCETCAKKYKITNESDYTGIQFVIEYTE